MKQRLAGIICAGTLVLAIGLLALGAQIEFEPSNYNPDLGENVTFSVCQSCLGEATFRYEWDFDSDGIYDVTTEEPLVTYTFTRPGYTEVTLKVTDAGGRAAFRKRGILVGASPLVAVRKLRVEQNGAMFVLITLTAKAALAAPGLEEMIPRGWQLEVVGAEGAFLRQGNSTLEVLWVDIIEQGMTWTFSYWLYPTYGSGAPALGGIASGYHKGKRVKAAICGDLSLPW